MKNKRARARPYQTYGIRFFRNVFTAVKSGWRIGTVVILGVAAGCTTQSKVGKTDYFFPPPPDQPRLQFLTSFSSEKEFHGGEEKNLMTYLTGAKPAQKHLSKPYGAAAGNKKIYICDTELGAVVVADLQAKHFGVIDAQGE